MSRSQLVAEHLPLLRRYSRALTGNQAAGDAYVGAMLEALLQDQSLLDERLGPRAGLFRLFTQIWNSVAINEQSEVVPSLTPSERRLSNITPLPRQAFLLLSLEGFSEEEVAFILGVDVGEVRKLADAAGHEMAAEIATDVLIIEDETFIAMDLESLVKNLGHNVIGVARTHTDAVALAKTKTPGRILADIQLADGSSGLDAVNELLRVFENLIENGLKYGASGGRVTVSLSRTAPDEGPAEIRVTVRDYGPGIAPEHLPRLTERFYRTDVGDSRAQGGTGLGLSLVKHIVSRHGGRLLIESVFGKGATFTVCFPPLALPPGA